MPLPGDALLDHAAAQVGVNQASLDTPDRIAESFILDSLAIGETRKGLGLVRSPVRATGSGPGIGCNTKCDRIQFRVRHENWAAPDAQPPRDFNPYRSGARVTLWRSPGYSADFGSGDAAAVLLLVGAGALVRISSSAGPSGRSTGAS